MHLGNQHLRGTLPTCVLQIHNVSVFWCRRNYNPSHRPLNPNKQHKDVWSLKQSPSLSRELLKLLDEVLRVELSRKVTLKLHEVHVCRHTSPHLPQLAGAIQEFPPVWSERGSDWTLNRWPWGSVAKRLVITDPTARSGEISPALWTYLQ